MRTVPAPPSISTRCPVLRICVASGTLSTAGMPYSRPMTAACDSSPPTSVTMPATSPSTGVHPGSVNRVTRISAGFSVSACSSAATTRTCPVITPALQPMPLSTIAEPSTRSAGTCGATSRPSSPGGSSPRYPRYISRRNRVRSRTRAGSSADRAQATISSACNMKMSSASSTYPFRASRSPASIT